MRLSLKTILAYKDNLFDAEYQPLIKQRISEQESAQHLIARIDAVTHDDKIGVPGRIGDEDELPANLVAAYLDHQLSDSEIAQFESICLRSDIFLAETASAHEILTTLLGQPAKVSRECRLKMYAIPNKSKEKMTQNTQITQNAESVKNTEVTQNTETEKIQNKEKIINHSEEKISEKNNETENKISQPAEPPQLPRKKHRLTVQTSVTTQNSEQKSEEKPKEEAKEKIKEEKIEPKTEQTVENTKKETPVSPVILPASKSESRLGQAFKNWKRRRNTIIASLLLLLLFLGVAVYWSFPKSDSETHSAEKFAASDTKTAKSPLLIDEKENSQRIEEHAKLWKKPNNSPQNSENLAANDETEINRSAYQIPAPPESNYFLPPESVYAVTETPSQVAQYLPQNNLPNLPQNHLPQNNPQNNNLSQNHLPQTPPQPLYQNIPQTLPPQNVANHQQNISNDTKDFTQFVQNQNIPQQTGLPQRVPPIVPEKPIVPDVSAPPQRIAMSDKNPPENSANSSHEIPYVPQNNQTAQQFPAVTMTLSNSQTFPATNSQTFSAPPTNPNTFARVTGDANPASAVSMQIRNRGNVQSVLPLVHQTLPAVQPAVSYSPDNPQIRSQNPTGTTGTFSNPPQQSENSPSGGGTSQQISGERSIQQAAYQNQFENENSIQHANRSDDSVWNEIHSSGNDSFEPLALLSSLQPISETSRTPQILQSPQTNNEQSAFMEIAVNENTRNQNAENEIPQNQNSEPNNGLPMIQNPTASGEYFDENAATLPPSDAEILLSRDDLALIRETPESNWSWLPVSKPLHEDIILIPAPFRAVLRFSNGIIAETEGDTRIRILPPDERQIPGIAFDCGHLIISATAPTKQQTEESDIQSASHQTQIFHQNQTEYQKLLAKQNQAANQNHEMFSLPIRILTPVGSGVLRLTDTNSYVSLNSENKTAIKLLRVVREYQSVTENPQFYNANRNENVMYCPNLTAFPSAGHKIFWSKETVSENASPIKKLSAEWELTSVSIFPIDEEKSITPILLAGSPNIIRSPFTAAPTLVSRDGKIPITKHDLKNQFITMPQTFFPTPSKTWLLK